MYSRHTPHLNINRVVPKQLDPRWVAARHALRPRIESLHRPTDWQPECASTRGAALAAAAAPADVARSLLSSLALY